MKLEMILLWKRRKHISTFLILSSSRAFRFQCVSIQSSCRLVICLSCSFCPKLCLIHPTSSYFQCDLAIWTRSSMN
jgi:hypothetical protein